MALDLPSKDESSRKRERFDPTRLLVFGTLALVVFFCGGGVLLYLRSLSTPRLIPGLRLQSVAVGDVHHQHLEAKVRAAARAFVGLPLTLRIGKYNRTITRSEIGGRVDVLATMARLKAIGKSGAFFRDLRDRIQARRGRIDVPLVATLDRARVMERFSELKGQVDRVALAPRLDLENGRILAGRRGYKLRIFASVAAAEIAIRRGANVVDLSVAVEVPPKAGRYKDLDISHVLGSFVTVYSQSDKSRDRAHNLNVGASRLDGLVLRPGESLSYNKVVGPRNRAQGYRTAHVISQGELVDGMAGGSCQLSSTLFAASFFAGLDLVSSRPHTMPSSYIKMGLDATVAYPTTDLVLRNPYPFPVAISFKVSQGKVRVKIYGKKRPWKTIIFKREIKRKEPFKEIIRDDPTIPRGHRRVAQLGIPGFVLERKRVFIDETGKVKKAEQRELRYPPTTQIVHRGTGKPDPAWKPKKTRRPFGDVAPEFSISR